MSTVESGPDGARRRMLGPDDQERSRVVIIKRGDRYIWASRGNRQLVRVRSGAYDYFIEPRGGGYVKVLHDPGLSILGMGDGGSDGPYPFLEHVTQHLATLTYFGEATDYRP